MRRWFECSVNIPIKIQWRLSARGEKWEWGGCIGISIVHVGSNVSQRRQWSKSSFRRPRTSARARAETTTCRGEHVRRELLISPRQSQMDRMAPLLISLSLFVFSRLLRSWLTSIPRSSSLPVTLFIFFPLHLLPATDLFSSCPITVRRSRRQFVDAASSTTVKGSASMGRNEGLRFLSVYLIFRGLRQWERREPRAERVETIFFVWRFEQFCLSGGWKMCFIE